jgi:hypothetical protein
MYTVVPKDCTSIKTTIIEDYAMIFLITSLSLAGEREGPEKGWTDIWAALKLKSVHRRHHSTQPTSHLKCLSNPSSIIMVHRPADSRLLTNLLTHEKDYSKHLLSLLDYSHASLASFEAYASASSPPSSHAILAVARFLAGADEALRRYAQSVEVWQDHLKDLKDLEEDVGNVMRDREIL